MIILIYEYVVGRPNKQKVQINSEIGNLHLATCNMHPAMGDKKMMI